MQKDAENTAVVYDIDCIDLEFVHPPRAQPANSLSILSYGADPTFTTDSTIAIQKCINDARSQGKSVWIPPGKYMVASLASTFKRDGRDREWSRDVVFHDLQECSTPDTG